MYPCRIGSSSSHKTNKQQLKHLKNQRRNHSRRAEKNISSILQLDINYEKEKDKSKLSTSSRTSWSLLSSSPLLSMHHRMLYLSLLPTVTWTSKTLKQCCWRRIPTLPPALTTAGVPSQTQLVHCLNAKATASVKQEPVICPNVLLTASVKLENVICPHVLRTASVNLGTVPCQPAKNNANVRSGGASQVSRKSFWCPVSLYINKYHWDSACDKMLLASWSRGPSPAFELSVVQQHHKFTKVTKCTYYHENPGRMKVAIIATLFVFVLAISNI